MYQVGFFARKSVERQIFTSHISKPVRVYRSLSELCADFDTGKILLKIHFDGSVCHLTSVIEGRVLKVPILLYSFYEGLKSLTASLDTSFQFGSCTFFPAKNLLRAQQDFILSEKEAALLLALLKASPAVVSRKDLLLKVWGYGDIISTHTLETHIYKLRQKIGFSSSLHKTGGGYVIKLAKLLKEI